LLVIFVKVWYLVSVPGIGTWYRYLMYKSPCPGHHPVLDLLSQAAWDDYTI